MPRSLRRQLAPRALSYREKQILGLVVQGYTNRQIADKLIVAESTVKTHLSSAFGKLDTRSRSEAAALIVDPEEGFGLGILPIPDTPPRRRIEDGSSWRPILRKPSHPLADGWGRRKAGATLTCLS